SDALSACAKARRRFGEELGLEPSPQLRQLERRILRHDPALAAEAATSRTGRPKPQRRRLVLVVASALALGAAAAAAIVVLARGDGRPDEPAASRTSSLLSLGMRSRAIAVADELPGLPAAIAASRTAVWIADPSNRQVLRADPVTGRIADRISLDGQPNALAVGRTAVWAASTLAGSIARIDPTTDAVTQTIRLGGA